MDFVSYLIAHKYLGRREYAQFLRDQFSDPTLNKFRVSPRIDLPADFAATLEQHPVAVDVLKRANVKTLSELKQKWLLYCLECFLPSTTYDATYLVGRKLNQDSLEKRLVAKFLNTNQVRGGHTFLGDGDTIAVLEGSSSFYSGMAACALKKNLGIVTSNGPLIHEHNANSQVASRLKEFHSIGGTVIADQGATFGPIAQTRYQEAITRNPGTTVIMVPVSGLTPDSGPYATEGSVRNLKSHLIKVGIDAQVREIIFIASWRKHLQVQSQGTGNEPYGTPVYAPDVWRKLLKENIVRMSLVTSPPPAIRAAIDAGLPIDDPAKRHIGSFTPAQKSQFGLRQQELEYVEASRKLHEQFQGQFYEATEKNTNFSK